MLEFTFIYMQIYLHIYIHIYVQVAHNFDTFYATKKFGMIFTQTKTLDFIVELPLGRARGQNQNGGGAKETTIWAKAIGWGHLCTLDTCLVVFVFFCCFFFFLFLFFCFS